MEEVATFSPLFIGARNVTKFGYIKIYWNLNFQSPFHRGKECYLDEIESVES